MMAMAPVKLLLSAISGYGYYYLKTLLEEIPENQARISGVIDPQPVKSGYFNEIISRGIPVYPDMEAFFRDGNRVDLTVISSPLQFHVPQSVTALKNGSNVLVDKPVGVTPEEVKGLIGVKNHSGQWVEVGYQWSFSTAIRRLKRDILDGRFGRPIRMKTICLWPRTYEYFNRNNWAGKIRTGDGTLVLDSVANNACAHFLHNMFFLTGPAMNMSSAPESVNGQRFRAYDIENFDTVACRAVTHNGIEIFFYASHATEKTLSPSFIFEFDLATIRMDETTNGIVAELNDGTEIEYGHPDADHQFTKLFSAIGFCHNPGPSVCPPEAALAQTICINRLHALSQDIKTFPARIIATELDRRWVRGLGEKMQNAYQNWSIELFPGSL
jgi:predicted dehydrogenase